MVCGCTSTVAGRKMATHTRFRASSFPDFRPHVFAPSSQTSSRSSPTHLPLFRNTGVSLFISLAIERARKILSRHATWKAVRHGLRISVVRASNAVEDVLGTARRCAICSHLILACSSIL